MMARKTAAASRASTVTKTATGSSPITPKLYNPLVINENAEKNSRPINKNLTNVALTLISSSDPTSPPRTCPINQGAAKSGMMALRPLKRSRTGHLT